MKNIKVILNPTQRKKFVNELLEIDGLSHIEEDPMSAYCPISLTQTPDNVKEFLAARQQILMDSVLAKAGITAYDPGNAPFSPDKQLSTLPQEIYLVDSGKIASSRFFVGHNLTASTGFGVELEKAVRFNKIVVILFDKKVRISRMQPHRAIYLQYDNFEVQASKITKVFTLLKEYEPGLGFDGDEPVLLGFNKKTQEAVNLEKLVYDSFPDLKYQYN